MSVHDVSTFKATQFAPLLNKFQKKFPGDPWRDTELGCQAVCEDFTNGLIKGTHSRRSDKFVLWVCDELSLKSRVIVLRHNLQSSRLFVREEGSLGGFPSCSSVRLYKILLMSSSENLPRRSEEHTSELQSHSDLVCRLLLEKKKTDKEDSA